MASQTDKKRCFVISPIGKEGSTERQVANDLLELIIQPALEKFGFEVIRADRIPRPGVITSEIIQLVQSADLCIIDLTGHNPNVFYECGRRHETGKPFIQIIRKGENIPFDLGGIRTIFYDISTPRSTNESQREIQSFVSEFEKQGYSASASSVVSLSSLASTLDKIERKLSQLTPLTPQLNFAKSAGLDVLKAAMNPREAYLTAIASGDFNTAAALLPRLEQMMGPSKEFLAAAGMVAVSGNDSALAAIRRVVEEQKDVLEVQGLQSGIGALVQYYAGRDEEEGGVSVVKPIIDHIIRVRTLDKNDEAWFLNQMQKLYYGSGQLENALEGGLRVNELQPDDVSYQFNLSLIYEKLGQIRKATELVDRYMSSQKEPDEDHLMHAVEIYSKVGRDTDAKTAFTKLAEVSAGKANLLVMRGGRELRKSLGL